MQGQPNQPGSQSSDNQPVDMSTQVQVTVDGQQVTMSIQDLANGYAAGSKMTQATQRAAELERELGNYTKFWNQLQQNPEAMIGELQTKFNITPQAPATNDGEGQETDPMSAEVTELKRMIAEQAATMQALQGHVSTQAQTQKMRTEIDGLEKQYGDAFKADEVATYAQTKGINDLTTAFHAMRGEGLATAPPKTPVSQTLSPVLPGSPVATGAITPDTKPATSLLESLQRGYAATGVDVEVGDLVPQ